MPAHLLLQGRRSDVVLSGKDIRALTDGMTDAAMMFDQVKKRLGARSVVVVEDEEEAAALLALMNEILPGAIAEAEKASEAYEPYRRLRFRSPEKVA